MNRKYFFGALSISLSFVLAILFLVGIIKIRFDENVRIISLTIILLFIISFTLYAYFSKSIKLYNKGIFISFLVNVLLFYSVIGLNETYDYIRNLIYPESTYSTYHVYVQKSTTRYSDLHKLSGKKIGMLQGNDENIEKYLNRVVSIECLRYENIYDLIDALLNGEVQSFILNEEDYNTIDEKNTNIKEKIRVISTSKIKETM